MDRERDFEVRMHPDKVRVESGPYARLANERRENLERIVTELRSRGRAPRVCLYALAVGEQEPERSLDAARVFAEGQRWQAGESFTDHYRWTTVVARPGWGLVRRQVRAGYADGVVVLAHSAISPYVGEYAEQLHWFEEHFAFIALALTEGLR